MNNDLSPDQVLSSLAFSNNIHKTLQQQMDDETKTKEDKATQATADQSLGGEGQPQATEAPQEGDAQQPEDSPDPMDEHKKRVDDMEVNTNKELEGLKTELEQVKKDGEDQNKKLDDIQKTLKEIANG